MYIPPAFEEIRVEVVDALITHAPLATLVAMTDEGLVANHLPLLAGPDRHLIGHVAKANDLHQKLENGAAVMAIFQGADAYVSPNYYPSKAEHHRHVPTWNYQVVHVHGTIRFDHDRQAKLKAVGLLTRHHERRVNGAAGWKMGDAPADYMEIMLDGIVAFTITPSRVLAKSKLSQNRDAEDRAGAIEGVRGQGDHAVAAAMDALDS